VNKHPNRELRPFPSISQSVVEEVEGLCVWSLVKEVEGLCLIARAAARVVRRSSRSEVEGLCLIARHYDTVFTGVSMDIYSKRSSEKSTMWTSEKSNSNVTTFYISLVTEDVTPIDFVYST